MLPRTLKNFNVFVNTHSWAGVAEEVTIPKITKKTEDFRGAGMIGATRGRRGAGSTAHRHHQRFRSGLKKYGSSDLPRLSAGPSD